MAHYVWQARNWPNFIWNSGALLKPLGQGGLLGPQTLPSFSLLGLAAVIFIKINLLLIIEIAGVKLGQPFIKTKVFPPFRLRYGLYHGFQAGDLGSPGVSPLLCRDLHGPIMGDPVFANPSGKMSIHLCHVKPVLLNGPDMEFAADAQGVEYPGVLGGGRAEGNVSNEIGIVVDIDPVALFGRMGFLSPQRLHRDILYSLGILFFLFPRFFSFRFDFKSNRILWPFLRCCSAHRNHLAVFEKDGGAYPLGWILDGVGAVEKKGLTLKRRYIVRAA